MRIFSNASERIRTLPNASGRIRTHPNRSEQVQTRPQTSENLRKPSNIENIMQIFKNNRDCRVRAVVVYHWPSMQAEQGVSQEAQHRAQVALEHGVEHEWPQCKGLARCYTTRKSFSGATDATVAPWPRAHLSLPTP